MAKKLCLGISPLSEIGEELETDKISRSKKEFTGCFSEFLFTINCYSTSIVKR